MDYPSAPPIGPSGFEESSTMQLFNSSRLRLFSLAWASLAGAWIVAHSAPAQAQAAYGSYVGVGAAGGLTRGDDGSGRKVSGVVNGRYKFLDVPVSVRAQAMIGSGVALVPTVSYDIPINWQTDAYVGIGAAIPITGNTPVGNKTGLAIQPGIDYMLPNSNMVLFGNAIFSFDAYKGGGGAAASLQGGVGVRF
jgi:hypothetical protein